MKTAALIRTALIFLLFAQAVLQGQDKTVLHGKVINGEGKALPYANVYLINSPDGTMSEDDGTFLFTTKLKGTVFLRASMVGYKTWTKEVKLGVSKDLSFEIRLEEKSVSFKESVVTASSYGSEKGKGLVVNRMDILTTPGGAADIFQALKTMPGLTQVSESAELYVRGGDPIETTTIINQAVVYHPFTFESGYGGLFSNINTSVIKSVYFTSGGFSAKYGNALSGVLDIETRDVPEACNYNLGISLANASFTASLPFVENKFGVYFDIRQSFTKPIFWLNGGLDRFTETPVSKNAAGGIVYSYSNTGRIKLFGVYADDREGVNVERAEYNGVYTGDSKNILFNLQNLVFVTESLQMKNSLSYNRYSDYWKIGVLDLTMSDNVSNFRTDFEYVVNSGTKVSSGFEYENRRLYYNGFVAAESYDYRPGADEISLESELRGQRWGFYSEFLSSDPFNIIGLSLSLGLRHDIFPGLKLNWTDPRFGIGYKFDDKSTIRIGCGIFHQIPDPRLFAQVDGNPNLRAMEASHYIASYDYSLNERNSFRIEVYHKKYDGLPLQKPVINYDNSGYGFANGVDIIFKGDFPFGISGWVSYGYINTKRIWNDYTELTNSPYDITHNLTIVAKYNLSEKFQIGMNAKYATGRPYTPVISSIYHPELNVYEPVDGATNSARFPDYKRVDVRLTYFDQTFNRFPLIIYAECLNILDLTNIFGYSYSPDYSESKVIKSYFGQRMIVIGLNLTVQ